MKGNEARVVFFLHPVDQVKDGKVAPMEPLKNSLGIISLLLLALLLGVLTFLFLTLEADPSQPEPDSTTESFPESTTSEPVTTGSAEVTSERPRENISTTEPGPFLPGKFF